jgi:hypothetical protein
MQAVAGQVLQGDAPQDSDIPLIGISGIVVLCHKESLKLHVLITTKVKLSNNLNMVNVMEMNFKVKAVLLRV